MPQDIKLWEIEEGTQLKELRQKPLDLEERLEDWIEKDVSIVRDDLLVIGRQVETDLGGIIDILCLDGNGDVIILELKRDKTPRLVTAQILEYAAWAKDLSNRKITEIAEEYSPEGITLEKSFEDKFDEELPEILNENHQMLIVGAQIDGQSEIIIEYLSDTYGVGINAVTFQHFEDGGKELLSRVFLIEPREAEYRIRTKGSSKRKPPLTEAELQEIADNSGVGDIYREAVEKLTPVFEYTYTTRSNYGLRGRVGEDDNLKTVLSLFPISKHSDAEQGLYYVVYLSKLVGYLDTDEGSVRKILPNYETQAKTLDEDYENGEGYIKTSAEIQQIRDGLVNLRKSA